MPKISTPKPDYTEKQFAAALKRAGCYETKPFLKSRRFYVMTGDTGTDVQNVPGIYEGRWGKINLRLTLKHLQSVRALAMADAKKNVSAPNSTNTRGPSASSEHDPDFFPTPTRPAAEMGAV